MKACIPMVEVYPEAQGLFAAALAQEILLGRRLQLAPGPRHPTNLAILTALGSQSVHQRHVTNRDQGD